MKLTKYLTMVIFLIFFSNLLNAQDTQEVLEKKIVDGVKALDKSIISVRPSGVYEASQKKFKYQWYPAVTLKKGTSFAEEEAIAKKLAKFIADFQNGVLTEGVMGGLIAIFEGDGWNPKICQVFYRLTFKETDTEETPPTVEVWTSLTITDDSGNVSCGDDGRIIGYIVNDKFKPVN